MDNSIINTLITGDCLMVLKELPDNCIDVSFADPPFNLQKKYDTYKDCKDFDRYMRWCKKWIMEMVRVTKPTGSIIVHNIPKWLTFYTRYLNKHATFRNWISWDAPTRPMGKTLQPAHYGILLYAKEPHNQKLYELRHPHKRCRKCHYLLKDYGGKKDTIHPFGPLISDVWTDIHRIKHNKYRDKHPCQLPLHLLERIILLTSDENDIVLDPFVGTGTSVIAAKRLNRNYIGIDISEKYIDITLNKLRAEQRGVSKIGNSYASFNASKIYTIRDMDWNNLKQYFELPVSPEYVDYKSIKRSSK